MMYEKTQDEEEERSGGRVRVVKKRRPPRSLTLDSHPVIHAILVPNTNPISYPEDTSIPGTWYVCMCTGSVGTTLTRNRLSRNFQLNLQLYTKTSLLLLKLSPVSLAPIRYTRSI